MSDFKKISGTPWHIETLHRSDYDSRRHLSRCIYYDNDCKLCKRRMLKCIGSAHCPHYSEYATEKFNSKGIHTDYVPYLPQNSTIKKDISEYIKKIPAKSYKITNENISQKRKRIAEKISGNAYSLRREFFSSSQKFEKYESLLCDLEESIIDCRLAFNDKKLQNTLRTKGIAVIQSIYNLICNEIHTKHIMAEKLDFKFINNFYYPLESFDSIKLSFEKCIYYRLNQEVPEIR